MYLFLLSFILVFRVRWLIKGFILFVLSAEELFLSTFSCFVVALQFLCVIFYFWDFFLIHFLDNSGYNLMHFICKMGIASLAPRANLTIRWDLWDTVHRYLLSLMCQLLHIQLGLYCLTLPLQHLQSFGLNWYQGPKRNPIQPEYLLEIVPLPLWV